jgi:4-hydroxy-2-oxoglutarate aldolase
MELAGVFAPVPTPFDGTGSVDVDRFRPALARWLATPLAGFVALGSNGEAAFVDEEESDRVVAALRELTPPARRFIVGAGRESTRATIRAARRAAELGADAVLVRTPGFFRTQMTSELFVAHYTTVADAVPVPVVLYNFTAVTGVDLLPDAVVRLSAHPNIVGIKESSGDIARLSTLVAETTPRFQVIAGSSSTFYASLCVGAAGGILALACVLPEACTRLYDFERQGRHAEAALLQRQLLAVSSLVGSRHGVPGLKAALAAIGLDFGPPRAPLKPLAAGGLAAIQDALAAFQKPVEA